MYIMSTRTKTIRSYATSLHSVQKAAIAGGEDEYVVSSTSMTHI